MIIELIGPAARLTPEFGHHRKFKGRGSNEFKGVACADSAISIR